MRWRPRHHRPILSPGFPLGVMMCCCPDCGWSPMTNSLESNFLAALIFHLIVLGVDFGQSSWFGNMLPWTRACLVTMEHFQKNWQSIHSSTMNFGHGTGISNIFCRGQACSDFIYSAAPWHTSAHCPISVLTVADWRVDPLVRIQHSAGSPNRYACLLKIQEGETYQYSMRLKRD